MWGYADLCLTIFDYERFESQPGPKFLDSLKNQVTDNRNLALTKRSVLNCSLVVWKKSKLQEGNSSESLMSKEDQFTGNVGQLVGALYSTVESTNA